LAGRASIMQIYFTFLLAAFYGAFNLPLQ
jgi:hypothetical protein